MKKTIIFIITIILNIFIAHAIITRGGGAGLATIVCIVADIIIFRICDDD